MSVCKLSNALPPSFPVLSLRDSLRAIKDEGTVLPHANTIRGTYAPLVNVHVRNTKVHKRLLVCHCVCVCVRVCVRGRVGHIT